MIAAPRQLSPREPESPWSEVAALLAVEQAARRYARHSHGNLSASHYREREEARDCLLDELARLDLIRLQTAGRRGMSKYRPMSGVFVGRPPCDICHAAYRLHEADGTCLQQYRPESLEQAEADLAAALQNGDPARIFVARGEVQRLKGK